jgi:hypothetical protein
MLLFEQTVRVPDPPRTSPDESSLYLQPLLFRPCH